MAVKHEANAAPREISRRGGRWKGLNGSEALAGGAVSGRQTETFTGCSSTSLTRNICAEEEDFRLIPECFF